MDEHVNRSWLRDRLVWLTLLTFATNLSVQAEALNMVAAAFKDPSQEWKDYPTRTLADLPPTIREKTDSDVNRDGGRLPLKAQATGFFRTTKRNDRWWLVDPKGLLCVYKGIAS